MDRLLPQEFIQWIPVILLLSAIIAGVVTASYWRRRLRERPQEFQFTSPTFRRLSASIIVLMSLLIGAITWWSLERIHARYQQQLADELVAVRDASSRNLELWVENGLLRLQGIAGDPDVVALVQALIEAKNQGQDLQTLPETRRMRERFQRLRNQAGILGFFIIDRSGLSIGSMRNANLNQRNLILDNRPDLFDRVLAGESVLVPPIPSDVRIQGSAPIRGYTVPPTMFFAVPVRDQNGEVVAVLTERLDPAGDFSEIMQIAHVGESGETYAFNHHGAMLSQSRFVDQLRASKRLYPGENPILSLRLRDPGPQGRYLKDYRVDTDLRSFPLTLAAQHAITKESGVNVEGYRDYRGIEVLGAWLWHEELGIGLVSEIDLQEAMQHYGIFRFWVLSLMGAVFLIFVVMLWSIMRIGAQANYVLRSSQEELEHRVRERTEALRDSEQRLEKVLDQVPAPIYLKDANGLYLLVNKRFEQVTGVSRDKALGRDDYAFQEQTVAEALVAMDNRVRENNKAYQEEEQVPHPDGTMHEYWSHKAPFPVSWDGEIGVLGVSIDISERKRVERAMKAQEEELGEALGLLEAIMESATYSIIATDTEGVIQVFNRAAEEMLQYHSAEVIGKHSPALFHDKKEVAVRAQLLSQELNQHIEPGFDVFVAKARIGFTDDNEWTYVRKDGVRIPVMLSVSALRDRYGQVKGFLGIAMDITERRRMEQELVESRDQAEVANLAKSEFLASMSHEIRTPMNGVLGMLDLVLQEPLDEAQRRKLMIAHSSARSLLAIINDILDFSKVESGKLELESIQFDVAQVLDDTVKAMAYRAEEKGLELILDQQGVSSTSMDGDPSRLRQILNNLISNAIKFTESGEIVVRARTRFYDEDHYQLMCEVSDTGIGIPAEKQEHLFDSFSQVDASTTRLYGGTGLGLAICKKMCELMQGDIKVSSEPGEGSRFRFTVLLGRRNKAPDRVPELDLSGSRLLVVDDNATNREIVSGQVQQWGMQVEESHSAADALEKLDKDAGFDVAILDMHMPDKDGLELAKDIRADKRFDGIKLLMLTSVSYYESSHVLLELGLDGILNKPIGTLELKDALRILLSEEGLNASGRRLLTGSYLESLRGFGQGEATSVPEQFELGDWPPQTRILLVEDNQINQMVTQDLLATFNLHCDLAGNGLEALAALEQAPEDAPYTLILMDCQMPEMDGYTATREIREGRAGERFKDIPIIAMTAHAMQGDREKCLSVGMNDYLSKPIDAKRMKSVLWSWLGGAEHQRTLSYSGAGVPGQGHSKGEVEVAERELLVWDEDGALTRMGGRHATMEAVIELFLNDVPERMEQLKQVLLDDPERARELAHNLKGSSGNIGGQRMQASALALEQALKQGAKEGLEPALDELDNAWQTLQQELKQWQALQVASDSRESAQLLDETQLLEVLDDLHRALEAGDFIDADDLGQLCQSVDAMGWKSEAKQLRHHLLSFQYEAAKQIVVQLHGEFSESS